MRRDLELLFEIGSMRNTPRAWRQSVATDVATVPEHTLRVIWLALIIARHEGIGSDEKIMKMALIHDVDECRTGDQGYVASVYVEARSKDAVHDTVANTSLEDLYSAIYTEYEQTYQHRGSNCQGRRQS